MKKRHSQASQKVVASCLILFGGILFAVAYLMGEPGVLPDRDWSPAHTVMAVFGCVGLPSILLGLAWYSWIRILEDYDRKKVDEWYYRRIEKQMCEEKNGEIDRY